MEVPFLRPGGTRSWPAEECAQPNGALPGAIVRPAAVPDSEVSPPPGGRAGGSSSIADQLAVG